MSNTLSALQAEPAGQHEAQFGGWISTEARLPENHAEVVIIGPSFGDWSKGRYSCISTFVDGIFYDEDGNDNHYPSHWMPLPPIPA